MKKFHVTQPYLESYVREALKAGKKEIVYPESLLLSSDFSRLIKLGFAYSAERKLLVYTVPEDNGVALLAAIADSDLLKAFTEKDNAAIEALSENPDAEGADEDEDDEEEAVSEPAVESSPAEEVVEPEQAEDVVASMQKLAAEMAKRMNPASTSTTPGTPGQPAVPSSGPAMTTALSEDVKQLLVGVRKQSIGRAMRDAEKRGVPANTLRLGREILNQLIDRVEATSQSLKLSVDGGSESADTFTSIMYLFESIPGIVPTEHVVGSEGSDVKTAAQAQENNLQQAVKKMLDDDGLHAYNGE